MATIKSTAETRVFTVSEWLGVNENPDGDTKLKIGEAAYMRNWRITKDKHLQVRPGYSPIAVLSNSPVLGLWHGYVKGNQVFVAVSGGKLWKIGEQVEEIGIVVGEHAHFFGFSEKLYLMTGSKYYVYDGTSIQEVAGYVPLVSISNVPAGGGTLLERVNLLTASRRAWFSPDGTATTFQLAETDLQSVDYVKKVSDGSSVTFTADIATGVVTITPALTTGVNSIEIGWTVKTNGRATVEAMRFSEVYNGAQDTRVFFYGNGTNKAIYSGLDYDGKATAEYFPDMNEVSVYSENTPITAMIKHYDSLLTFKTDGAFVTSYGNISLADGTLTSAFYVSPLNREIGNVALGQAVLVKNNPLTLFGRSVYEWQLSTYSSKDERNAKRKSDKVISTLAGIDIEKAICFDDEYNTEYYICQGGKAIVYNYTADAWYVYDNIPATCLVMFDGKLYFGTTDGKIMHFSRKYRNDNGVEINARWESGAMDFARDYRLKYSSDIWLALKPESQARLTITAQSNKASSYADKVVASSLVTFTNMDFNHFSFATNRQPQVDKVKLKVKKFTFYRLILTSVSKSATATVLGADIKVRYAGNVK